MGAKSGRNKRGGRGGPKKAAAPQAAKGGRGNAQRFGLVLFAIVFIAIFVIFAVAQGLGAPKVPSGDIAVVSGIPSEIGHISEATYKTVSEQQEVKAGLKKPPKAGSKKAKELHEAAVGELLQSAWLLGEAEEDGIKVTEKEIETELAKIKKESFKTEKAFQEFLTESHLTAAEVNELLKVQKVKTKLEEKVKKEAPPVTEAEQEEYYEAEKATQFTKKPSRDVRVIVNENKKEVEAAKKALEADNSEKGWEAATKKYSPTTEANAGLQKEITEEFLQEPLKKDIFQAQVGELVGPVKEEKSYLLLEVAKLHPQKVQTFAEVKTTISTTLGQEREQKFLTEWISKFLAEWTQRTRCASGFQTELCANFPASAALAKTREAYKSCYEANPKKAPTECPAAVKLTSPAVPGTVTRSEPKGEAIVQRPHPEAAPKGAGKAAAEAAAGAAGAAGAEGNEGAAGASPEEEAAAQKAVEEAEEKAAEEAASSGGAEAGGAAEGAAKGKGSSAGKKAE